MTFMTVTYELQKPLTIEQYRALGNFANTYGLQRFRFDEKTNYLHFDYDASRLRESVVEHVLREARIPVLRPVPGRRGAIAACAANRLNFDAAARHTARHARATFATRAGTPGDRRRLLGIPLFFGVCIDIR